MVRITVVLLIAIGLANVTSADEPLQPAPMTPYPYSDETIAPYSTEPMAPYAPPLAPVESYATPQPVPFDPYTQQAASYQPTVVPQSGPRWMLDILPDGLIYRPYLAGPKESRTGFQYGRNGDDWTFDSSIGGQWGLFRYGTPDPYIPKGIQLDVEASAQLRHRNFASGKILTTDFRFGVPLSYSRNNHQTKLSVYFLRANPNDRLWDRIRSLWSDEFFQRSSLVLGHSIYPSKKFRIYGEVGYAFKSRVSDQWEFQFGGEYAPVCHTGLLGAPFVAANAYLREEVDYGGIFTLQAGWAWRKSRGRLCRIGLHYANGKSNHTAIHDLHEQQIGFGIWFDR